MRKEDRKEVSTHTDGFGGMEYRAVRAEEGNGGGGGGG
jgi:hypothetical protein